MSVWDRLVGQPEVTAQLARAAAEDRPTHAWLFTGPPGSGRSEAARAFAAALLCDSPEPSQRGCGVCKSCQTALSGSHADLTHFTTENLQIRIEEARDLVVKAQDRPSVGRWRVIILEDADRMPERTSNVLLKAIEEPPPHTIWLLTAPSPLDVLVTIRSRCRPVKLRVPSQQAVAEALVASGVAAELAGQCAALAQGNLDVARQLATSRKEFDRRNSVVRMPLGIRGISDAMAAAEKLIGISDDAAEAVAAERNERERQELMRTLGIEEGEKVNPSMRAQLRNLEEDQKRRARRIKTDTLDRFLVDLQTFFRDVLTLQLGTGSALINAHLADELAAYAQARSSAKTLELLDSVALTRRRISTNASAKLAFEAMMASFL